MTVLTATFFQGSPGAAAPMRPSTDLPGTNPAGTILSAPGPARDLSPLGDLGVVLVGLLVVHLSISPVGLAFAVLPPLWLILLSVLQGYRTPSLGHGVRTSLRPVQRAAIALALGSWVVSTLVDPERLAPQLLLLTILVAGGSTALRVAPAVLGVVRRPAGAAGTASRVVVVGHVTDVARMVRAAARDSGHRVQVVGVCLTTEPKLSLAVDAVPRGSVVEPFVTDEAFGVPVSRGLDALGAALLSCEATVVVAMPGPGLDHGALRRLSWQLAEDSVQLLVGTSVVDVAPHRTSVASVGGLPLLAVNHPTRGTVSRGVKAVVDRIIAAVLLALLAPVLALLVLTVRLDSSGRAIFRQVRVGRDGAPFTMLKLRTMTDEAETVLADLPEDHDGDGLLFKLRVDPRITRVGGALRRLSLDELPQLINVVRGEMSLIGPRPALAHEVELYDTDVRRRLGVKPGLTGLWQVSGRSDLSWAESVRLDLHYVDNWSLWMDARIAWRTVGAVLSRRGAY